MKFREGVCILVYREADGGLEGFVGKSVLGPWQVVAGGVEGDETYKETALREFEEETGIPKDRIIKIEEFPYKNVYSHDGDEEFGIEPHKGVQKAFAVKIEPEEEVETNREFTDFEFLPKEEMLERIDHENLRNTMEKVWNEVERMEGLNQKR